MVIAGHKTSLSLEKAFWIELKRISDMRGIGITVLVSLVDDWRREGNHYNPNLSSACRLYVLDDKNKYIQRITGIKPIQHPTHTHRL